MSPDRLRERIAAQFSYRSERADIWRVLDRLLDGGAYLNLGYSGRFRSHLVGSSQRRLAIRVGEHVAQHLPSMEGDRLLDVGCGRGGPTIHLADRLGVRAAGVDIVPYNVARAAENARERSSDTGFVVGDATQLPFAPESVAACTAIDALVYVPDRAAVFDAVAEVLEPGGVVVVSDLVARPDLDDRARRAVDEFADAWDMAPPGSVPAYERALASAGFTLRDREDISANSVGRFRKWTAACRALVDGPADPLVERGLRRSGLDPATVTEQVRRTHEALPHLRHGLLVATKRER